MYGKVKKKKKTTLAGFNFSLCGGFLPGEDRLPEFIISVIHLATLDVHWLMQLQPTPAEPANPSPSVTRSLSCALILLRRCNYCHIRLKFVQRELTEDEVYAVREEGGWECVCVGGWKEGGHVTSSLSATGHLLRQKDSMEKQMKVSERKTDNTRKRGRGMK